MPNKLKPKLTSRVLSCPTPTSSPSMIAGVLEETNPVEILLLHASGDSRIFEWSYGEGTALMMCQKPEALNQTNDSFDEHF